MPFFYFFPFRFLISISISFLTNMWHVLFLLFMQTLLNIVKDKVDSQRNDYVLSLTLSVLWNLTGKYHYISRLIKYIRTAICILTGCFPVTLMLDLIICGMYVDEVTKEWNSAKISDFFWLPDDAHCTCQLFVDGQGLKLFIQVLKVWSDKLISDRLHGFLYTYYKIVLSIFQEFGTENVIVKKVLGTLVKKNFVICSCVISFCTTIADKPLGLVILR